MVNNMKISNISVHCEKTGAPDVEITQFDEFCSIKIGEIGNAVDFYLGGPQDVIDFQDNFMDTYVKFMEGQI